MSLLRVLIFKLHFNNYIYFLNTITDDFVNTLKLFVYVCKFQNLLNIFLKYKYEV